MIDSDDARQVERLVAVACAAHNELRDAGFDEQEAATLAGHIAQAMQLWWRQA